MKLGIPQLAMLILAFMDLGINLGLHGEERQGEYNFWVALFNVVLHMFILYKGGFFR